MYDGQTTNEFDESTPLIRDSEWWLIIKGKCQTKLYLSHSREPLNVLIFQYIMSYTRIVFSLNRLGFALTIPPVDNFPQSIS